ncbi:MAG TPA: methylmalonyl Co-A mutase-associated GTPase MeaB, partial [Vicinamibacteria bacterium]|nr:methylmalonyl Co-A mutase-associated GTPase MeaB [Vicinamibacteria bacterium]
ASTAHVVTVMAASGKDVVLVETVGVGQDEVDIVSAADVSLVVLVPGLGDEVQALKAGIMEIADVFVVNKADRDGVDRLVTEIQAMLSLAGQAGPRPEIVKTVATSDAGIDELMAAVAAFHAAAATNGTLARKRRGQATQQFREALQSLLLERVRERALPPDEAERLAERLAARETDPFSAAAEVLRRMGL